MGLKFSFILILKSCIFLFSILRIHSDSSEVSVKLLNAPRAFSNTNSATFEFKIFVGRNWSICRECLTNCKLDDGLFSSCNGRNITYVGLLDGNHSFEVCSSIGLSCVTYQWIVDTHDPTASISAATTFTSASSVPVMISFSEPCGSSSGGDGFRCSSIKDCNLLVYGAGQVVPDTLNVVQPNLKYSITVALSERVRYGRLILVMDKHFCTDDAGNEFTRTQNSSLLVRFDKRIVVVSLRTHIPERLLQINNGTRTVIATNKIKNLKVYLYFTEPVLNSSAEILNSINTSQGLLVPVSGNNFGKRRFGYQLTDIPEVAVVTLSVHSNLVISRQGTPIAPVSPITFLYDSQRPIVRLSTTSYMRTKEKIIPILIKFTKPVYGFNSSHISISGGHLQSFYEMSKSTYTARIQADTEVISVVIPHNVATDVSGNRNGASNTIQVRHYSVPITSFVVSTFVTVAFAVTSLVSAFLTVSTTSLLSIGAFSRPSSLLCSDPARSLFRIAYHIQVFALSRWLGVSLPVEYYELARGLRWSIPYFHLPWERENADPFIMGSNSPKDRLSFSSEIHDSIIVEGIQPMAGYFDSAAKVYGLPLTSMEYTSFFESKNIMQATEYILDPQNSQGWRDFSRSMFWLAAMCGSLILLHVLVLLILKFKKTDAQKPSYGALIFPRFEIFLIILSLPCLSIASAAIVKGGTSSGIIVGLLLLSLVAFLLISLLLFLSIGITFGKLLKYKEVLQEEKTSHWYQKFIRVTLGPGKRGQWTWKNRTRSYYLTILGPIFEDLRGPPKYILSQIDGGGSRKRGDNILASDDETEDAESSFIQKVFGILRINYTFLECAKRVILGIIAGVYSKKWSSKTPTITLLSITSFQLLFMVLKKPFIKKRVQLIEIVSVSSELVIFGICYVFLAKELSFQNEKKVGLLMVLVFLFSFLVQMINEWYALYKHIKQMNPATNSFFTGLRTGFVGVFLLFCPHGLTKKVDIMFPIHNLCETGDTTTTTSRNRSSSSISSNDKPWMKRVRELAKSSSVTIEENKATPNDPSTSKARSSGFWRSRVSGSESTGSASGSTSDLRSKSWGLYRELEDIFASK